jgi:hypothetical protein
MERINDEVSKQGVGFSLEEFEPNASFGLGSMNSSGAFLFSFCLCNLI